MVDSIPHIQVILLLILLTWLNAAASNQQARFTRSAFQEKLERHQMDSNHNYLRSNLIMWSVERFPDPKVDPQKCNLGQYNNKSICDPDKLLNAEEIKKLEEIIEVFDDYPLCVCDDEDEEPRNGIGCEANANSIKVAITVMRHINFDLKKQDFAAGVRKKYNLGKCDNSLLVMVATDDRMFEASFGDTAEALFERTFLKQLPKESLELMSQKKFYKGIYTYLRKLYKNMIYNNI